MQVGNSRDQCWGIPPSLDIVSVIADAYLAGVSTRRVEKLVQQLGVERMSTDLEGP